MGGGDRDEDAGFANGEAAEAMDDCDVADGEVLDGLGAEEVHLLQRHLLVGFVVEVQRAAAAGIVANDAVEDADGSVGSGLDSRSIAAASMRLTHQGDQQA